MSGCHEPIEMPVCQHLTPVKLFCSKCNPLESINLSEELQNMKTTIAYINDNLSQACARIERLEDRTEPNPAVHILSKRIEILESFQNYLENSMKIAQQDLTKVYSRVKDLEDAFGIIDHIVAAAKNAEGLFAQKVHDLKFIDQKRDDVINALCQKVEALNRRFDHWMEPKVKMTEHAGLMEKLIDKL